jgi:hypothetical protein
MFGLLRRAPRRIPPAPRSFRPCLEQLETRFCPSTLTLNAAYTSGNSATLSGQLTGAPNDAGQTINLGGYGGTTTATTDTSGDYTVTVLVTQPGTVSAGYMSQDPASASATLGPLPNPTSPSLTLNYAYTTGNNATFSGQLTGTSNNAAQTINISGYGGTTTATTDANGNYSVTVAVTQPGTVTASYTGQQPATASVKVAASSSLTLNFAYDEQNNVTFSGQLTGEANNAGQTITITGYGGTTTVTTDANGNYSIVLAVTQLGTVTASYSGQQPATASVNVNPPPPNITSFGASQEPNGYWEFSGTITGTPDPEGLVIQLSGLPALQGMTITVNANGTFSEEFQLNGESGTVECSVTDWWGRSDSEMCAVT